jgi:hypothetical protein
MAIKKVGQKDHKSRKNPAAHEKWIAEKKIGRPRQSYDLVTKKYTRIYPSGVVIKGA